MPLTIGVFGDWGSGKTSILKMLERDLDPDLYDDEEEKARYSKIACLYFNGWLFEGYDDAKSAILTSVLLQLGEHKRFGTRVRDKVVSLLKTVNWMRIVRLGLTDIAFPAISAYITGGTSIIPSLAKKLFSDKGENGGSPGPDTVTGNEEESINWANLLKTDVKPNGPLDVRTFRDRFAEMLRESDIDSLVVLIDDLDRCTPERIIDNLEAIKLFLNVENTAFVIGADPRIVRHAIANRYNPAQILGQKDQEHEAEKLVNDYLEKLIQIPYRIPRLSPSEVETYMALLFCARDINDNPINDKILDACRTQRNQNRYSVFGYADVKKVFEPNDVPAALSNSLQFAAFSTPLITEGLKGNPRQIKRFLNALFLRKELSRIANVTGQVFWRIFGQ